eukprot:GILJ01002849.1.p1 GENE.GILJ01002849.1~~GILJ01002849.1.p1  ORF type:complete len:521 (+),score=84.83 GILJ01002849.1:25-1563(+)
MHMVQEDMLLSILRKENDDLKRENANLRTYGADYKLAYDDLLTECEELKRNKDELLGVIAGLQDLLKELGCQDRCFSPLTDCSIEDEWIPSAHTKRTSNGGPPFDSNVTSKSNGCFTASLDPSPFLSVSEQDGVLCVSPFELCTAVTLQTSSDEEPPTPSNSSINRTKLNILQACAADLAEDMESATRRASHVHPTCNPDPIPSALVPMTDMDATRRFSDLSFSSVSTVALRDKPSRQGSETDIEQSPHVVSTQVSDQRLLAQQVVVATNGKEDARPDLDSESTRSRRARPPLVPLVRGRSFSADPAIDSTMISKLAAQMSLAEPSQKSVQNSSLAHPSCPPALRLTRKTHQVKSFLPHLISPPQAALKLALSHITPLPLPMAACSLAPSARDSIDDSTHESASAETTSPTQTLKTLRGATYHIPKTPSLYASLVSQPSFGPTDGVSSPTKATIIKPVPISPTRQVDSASRFNALHDFVSGLSPDENNSNGSVGSNVTTYNGFSSISTSNCH